MIYNVVTRVVELVEADSADEAISKLHTALDRAGFAPYLDGTPANAFESEPLDAVSLDGVLR